MLRLPPELTHLQANTCLDTLVAGLASSSGPQVLVDASALQRFDSSALAVLLEFGRRCGAQGKALAVQGLPDRLGALASVYGVDALLPRA